jgi:hypothetical protein
MKAAAEPIPLFVGISFGPAIVREVSLVSRHRVSCGRPCCVSLATGSSIPSEDAQAEVAGMQAHLMNAVPSLSKVTSCGSAKLGLHALRTMGRE